MEHDEFPAARASRPYMPGYGVVGPNQGSGLLPWSWAHDRLTASHDFWLVFSLDENDFTGSPTRWSFAP